MESEQVESVADLELEEVRRELAAVREDLRQSREHLTLFAGQVSHDLRTPLTAIRANAEMLAAEPAVTGDADLAWMVDGIERATQRLNTMIEQMLDHARQGGVPTPAPTALCDVFDLALADLAPLVAERGAEVSVGPLPEVTVDPGQLYEVALNLLTNALTFSREDVPPRVVVAAERLGDRWRVRVSDNGIGVPPERQEAMFVLFARADKRTGGSGIGLASARRLVEAHGGRIGMESTPGSGTTVWFELPA